MSAVSPPSRTTFASAPASSSSFTSSPLPLPQASEIGWTPVSHPRDVLRVGERIQVEILRLDPERSRIALSVGRGVKFLDGLCRGWRKRLCHELRFPDHCPLELCTAGKQEDRCHGQEPRANA